MENICKPIKPLNTPGMTNPGLFNRFFAPAADLADFVHILDIGPLSLPSGRLIAADPLVGLDRDTPPFTRSLPPGEYPVQLCILSDDPHKNYGEYAAARVCFTERQAVRFEQALVGTEDPAGVEAGKSFGFPVDTGMACFCDAEACAALCGFEEQMQQQKPGSDLYNDLWCELLEENARLHPDYQSGSGDWLNFRIPGTGYHLPLFRSGYGDGCYTTYWGIDADGNICQAITEFIGLEDAYRTYQRKQERKNFRPDGQQSDGPERIARRIASLRTAVSEHPGGHLPLARRVELYRHIGNPALVQRILCECCKKVYPLWEQYVCRDQSFLHLLRAANDVLYHGKATPDERRATREALVRQAEALSNYAAYYGNNPRSIAAYAIVRLCYSILCRAEDVLKWEEEEYKGEDDTDSDYFDPESLAPDFIAEMAYVGQPEAGDDATAPLRREYWLWFLDMAESLYRHPQQEYLALPASAPEPAPTLFTRCQSYIDGDYPMRPLTGIIRTLEDYLQGSGWEQAELTATIFTGISLRLRIQKGNERQTVASIPGPLYDLTAGLHQQMYNRCPSEGAWMECRLTLTPQGGFTLGLNYDDKDALSEPQRPDTFAAAFAAHPRSRLFTPAWWQNLLSYDTPYLLSPAEKAAAVRIGISGSTLSLNGVPLDFPLSPNALVRQLGEERLTKGYRTATGYDGNPVEYASTSFLLWDYAGILATRDDEDAYRIAALYLQMLPRTETDTALPLPEHPFSGTFTVDGRPFRYEAGTTIRSGRLEITASESSKGYVEIVCSNARSHRIPSHHYRTSLEENRRLALDDREHIRALEKAEARGKDYHPGLPNKKLLLQLTKDYLTHALAALTAGYALGKSEKYLRSLLLGPLAEAALKRYEYRKIREATLLPVLSAFVLLGPDPRDFEKFAAQLKASGVRDFVTDTLVRSRLPHWEVTEHTAFPGWKALLTGSGHPGDTTTAEPEDTSEDTLENAPEDSPAGSSLLIRDAILKIIHTL